MTASNRRSDSFFTLVEVVAGSEVAMDGDPEAVVVTLWRDN